MINIQILYVLFDLLVFKDTFESTCDRVPTAENRLSLVQNDFWSSSTGG